MTEITPDQKLYIHYEKLFKDIFSSAFEKDLLSFIATILRFDGMFFGHWDPLEESKDTFRDFLRILEQEQKNGNRKEELKISLLLYCHSIEMTQVQNVIANLLGILSGSVFKMRPLWDDEFRKKRRKSKTLFFQPPGLTRKFKTLTELSKKADREDFTKALEEIFDSNVRNSFSHSDYCIDLENEKYRFTEGGPGQELELSYIEELINKTLTFFDAFFSVWEASLLQITGVPHYLMTSDYDVLELLVEDKKLYGFALHHSNGSKSVFERRAKMVNCMNFFSTEEGFGVQVGDLGKLKKGWFVDGVEIFDFEKLNKEHPLV